MSTTEPNRTEPGGQDDASAAAPADGMTTGQWVRLLVLGGLLVLLTATSGIWGLVVVFGIVAMVFFHELGHFIAAKRAGMLVTEFFIGFGPRIWSFRRGGTEYGLKVIPAGAYVKIIGMHNLEEVEPGDEGRAYRQGRFRDRFAVVTAGVAMNFLLALVLIWTVLAVTGTPGGSLTDKPDASRWIIGRVYPGTGAAAAGIVSGDKILAIDRTPVAVFSDIGPIMKQHQAGDVVQVSLLRHGRTIGTSVTLAKFTAEDGSVNCCLGVREGLADVRVNPVTAVPQSFKEFGVIGFESVKSLGKFFSPSGLSDFGHQVVDARNKPATAANPGSSKSGSSGANQGGSGQSQDQNRLISLIGVFRIGTQAAESGVAGLLVLFALLNTFLGIMNLLPLLPFDGGHAVIAVYERIQERRHHQRARYFADVSRLLPLTYAVVLVLIGIFVTTTYLDLANPLKITK